MLINLFKRTKIKEDNIYGDKKRINEWIYTDQKGIINCLEVYYRQTCKSVMPYIDINQRSFQLFFLTLNFHFIIITTRYTNRRMDQNKNEPLIQESILIEHQNIQPSQQLS